MASLSLSVSCRLPRVDQAVRLRIMHALLTFRSKVSQRLVVQRFAVVRPRDRVRDDGRVPRLLAVGVCRG